MGETAPRGESVTGLFGLAYIALGDVGLGLVAGVAQVAASPAQGVSEVLALA